MDVLIWTIGTVVCSRIERVKQFRSPIVPKWDSPPLTPAGVMAVLLDGDSGPILTEHGLKLVHETWQTRHAALWLRQRALRDARSKGLIGCWAGMCTPATLQATKEAVEEAQWVEQHLSDAIEWCQGRKVAKMPFGKFVKARGGANESARADIRPTYLETPPSLLDLPFPLPLAPQSSRLAPIVSRPPSLHQDESQAEEEERLRPPLYTEEADLDLGESTLEGGMWHDPNESRAYEAAVNEDDDVLAMLQRHYPEDYAHFPRTS